MSGFASRRAATLVASLATAHDAAVVRQAAHELLLEVSLLLADGRRVAYRIAATASGPRVTAREHVPRRLPAFCPERHINRDGTFCMNWQAGDPLDIVDADAAHLWWATLLQFLRHQERAKRLRRWPDRRAWAHGAAAEHQRRAEDHAATLGTDFVHDLRRGHLEVVRWTKGNSANGPSLRLFRHGRRAFAVWERHRRVINLRRACVCKRSDGRPPRALSGCADHAQAAAGLVLALHGWEIEEARFWEGMKDLACCGTMDGCPLCKKASGTSPPPLHLPVLGGLAA